MLQFFVGTHRPFIPIQLSEAWHRCRLFAAAERMGLVGIV